MTNGEWFKSQIDNETLANMMIHTTCFGCRKCIARDICYEMSNKTCLQTIKEKLDQEYVGD